MTGMDMKVIWHSYSMQLVVTTLKLRKRKRRVLKRLQVSSRRVSCLSWFVENAGGYVITGADNVVNKTTTSTFGAVKGTAAMTKNVVKGTGKQTKSAAKGTANFLRLPQKK